MRQEGAHDVIGDRALGAEPMQVAALGRAVLDGLEAGGVLGVVKHMPGHGRARADSHGELPVVEPTWRRSPRTSPRSARSPTRRWRWPRMCCSGLGRRAAPAVSPTVIADIVRGEIGFDGLLMSDDIAMGALSGTGGRARAAARRRRLRPGAALLGQLAENEAIAGALGGIDAAAGAARTGDGADRGQGLGPEP